MATSTSPANVVVMPPDGSTNLLTAESLREVKPPVPIADVGPYLVLAGVLLAVLGGLVLAWLWRRRNRGDGGLPAVVVVPAHRRARERLQAALDLLHDPKAFTTVVSGALRVYLEERFELRAPERTTDEFLGELQASEFLSAKQKEILVDFLRRSDLVKFARLEPTEDELRGLWDVAMDLVMETAEPGGGSDRSM